MKRLMGIVSLLGFSLFSQADEHHFDLSKTSIGELPSYFKPVSNGKGLPAKWKVDHDVLPSAMTRISPLANTNLQKVISQFSKDQTSDRYAMLIYDSQSFDDFEMSVLAKVIGGKVAQHLGIVFRFQDPQNYYSFRLDVGGGWYYFRKVVDGKEQEPIGNRLKLIPDQWHKMQIECKGSSISLSLDGNQLPTLNDTQFAEGKIGFWIHADTLAHFGGGKIRFRPKLSPAQRLVDQIIQKYNRLIGVSIYASEKDDEPARIVASNFKKDIGMKADHAVMDVISRGKIYYSKKRKSAIVTLPIKDRNGEMIAACRVELQRFRGQTQNNAIVRSMPAVRMIEAGILDRIDLFR